MNLNPVDIVTQYPIDTLLWLMALLCAWIALSLFLEWWDGRRA